jgi:rubredoxin
MRKKGISYIDFNEQEPDNIYCPRCLRINLKVKVELLIPEGEPSIYNNDYICPNCNFEYRIDQTKPEVEYEPVFDVVTNDYEGGSQFAGVEPRAKSTTKREKRTRKLDNETVFDKDMVVEKGQINILYDSQGNY